MSRSRACKIPVRTAKHSAVRALRILVVACVRACACVCTRAYRNFQTCSCIYLHPSCTSTVCSWAKYEAMMLFTVGVNVWFDCRNTLSLLPTSYGHARMYAWTHTHAHEQAATSRKRSLSNLHIVYVGDDVDGPESDAANFASPLMLLCWFTSCLSKNKNLYM